MSSNFISNFMVGDVEKHKSKNTLDDVVSNVVEKQKSKSIWNVRFTYKCDTEGPAEYQHEESVFDEEIDDGLSYFTPNHNLTPLNQHKDAIFQIFKRTYW